MDRNILSDPDFYRERRVGYVCKLSSVTCRAILASAEFSYYMTTFIPQKMTDNTKSLDRREDRYIH